MYKVFFNDRNLILTDQLNDNPLTDMNNWFLYKDIKPLRKFIENFLQNEDLKEAIIFNKDLKKLWKVFKENFKYIIAAGGLVFNPDQEFLAIHRLNRWDLPKGKADKGESPEQTALREVQEECGITEHKIVTYLTSTYHIYHKDKKQILKQTYWYEMSYDKNETLIPQTKENIKEARWINPENVSMIMKNTYPSILEVLKSKQLLVNV